MALAPATVQRMPARLNGAPICLQPASTTSEEMHRPLARSAATTARSRPATKLGTTVPDPLVGQVCAGAVDGLAARGRSLFAEFRCSGSLAMSD